MQTIRELKLSEIVPGHNDRTSFDPEQLRELADSIKEHGLIQPITVRRATRCRCCELVTAEQITHCPDCDADTLDDVYQITAGERRFRASKLAGLGTIAAIVRDLTDEEQSILMLAENVARADLDPIDEALAYQTRIETFGWTIAECAKNAGVSTVRVRFRTKLLSLRADIVKLIRDGHLALGYAQILSDGDLDTNRQLIALRKLRDNGSPMPAWFRRVVGELVEQQSQDCLFSLDAFTVEQFVDQADQVAQVQPPSPETDTAPVTGTTAVEVLQNASAFWTAAASEWEMLGKTFKRNECAAAAAALQNAVAAIENL